MGWDETIATTTYFKNSNGTIKQFYIYTNNYAGNGVTCSFVYTPSATDSFYFSANRNIIKGTQTLLIEELS